MTVPRVAVVEAELLRRTARQASVATGAPTAFDLAFAALVDLVELRARKLYPEKFADPPAGSPSLTATEE